MSQEDIRELETQEETTTKPKKKNIAKKIIAFILAATVSLTSVATYIFRNNIKVRNSETSEIEALINNDNAIDSENEPKNTQQETIDNLTKIETYLTLSNTLENLYERYKDKINNINIGTAIVSENAVVELSEEKYNELCNYLEIIANSKKEDDKYYQAVGKAVSYLSYVNAWLAYNAPKTIYDTLLNNCANDVANGLELDYQRITVAYDNTNHELNITRNDNGTGESSYDIEAKGIRISMIKDTLSNTYEIYTKTSDFLASGDQSIYNEDGKCLMTVEDNQGLIVYRNKELNNNIKKYLEIIRLVLCSTYTIENAEFKYNFAIPDPTSKEQDISSNLDITKTYLSQTDKSLTLKR